MHSYSKIGGSSDFASRYPTRILVGHWLYSSEDEPNQHAVYGILSRDGKLRFKLVSETRDGKTIRGNYPPPSETWLIHEEIVLLPHLLELNRLGMKEYCRERGRHVSAGEEPGDVEANIKKAVEYAERVSTSLEGQRPRNLRWEREKCADRQRAIRKLGTASAQAKAIHEQANGISPSKSDLDLSQIEKPPSHHRSLSSTSQTKKKRSASPLAEPTSANRYPYKPPSPRARGHPLPNDRPASSFRAANVKVDEDQDRLPSLKSVTGFHTTNGDGDDNDRLPPLAATLAADGMDIDDKDKLPPIQMTQNIDTMPPKQARQPLPQRPYDSPPQPRKALPTSAVHSKRKSINDRSIIMNSPPTGDEGDDDDDDEPRSKLFNGITYVRKTHGSFKGKLVSPGKIITIDGQDYVEYCVLAKLSFV